MFEWQTSTGGPTVTSTDTNQSIGDLHQEAERLKLERDIEMMRLETTALRKLQVFKEKSGKLGWDFYFPLIAGVVTTLAVTSIVHFLD